MKDFINTRFADPTVDFAFKRIFGTEQYKKATIGLLNSLFDEVDIIDVKFLNNELIGETFESRKGFIDVLCEDSYGDTFIVEMQNARQEYFRERTIFYSSKMIAIQEPRGDWDFKLRPTYVVAFLNFPLHKLAPELENDGRYILRYRTKDLETGRKMPGSTEFVFLGLQDFDKKYEELETYPEKWLYCMRDAATMTEAPSGLVKDAGFETFFDACWRAGFTKQEEHLYITDMMTERDIKNAKDLAVREGREEGRQLGLEEGREEGRKEGRAEGRAEEAAKIAKAFLDRGVDINVISECTGLTPEFIYEEGNR